MTPAEHLARRFHEAYKRLAPSFGYTTREETRAFDPTTPNSKLMVAVCAEITDAAGDPCGECSAEIHRLREALTNLVNTFHEGRAIPQDSRSEGYVLAAVEAAEAAIGGAVREPELSAMCAACGKSYGEHNYSDCLNGKTRFKPVALPDGVAACERGRGTPAECGAAPACGCPAALSALGVEGRRG